MRQFIQLCFGTCLSTATFAAQLQVRSFHSQTRLSHEGASEPILWSGSYLKNSPPNIQNERKSGQILLNSPGQELTLGFLLTPYFMVDLGVSQTFYYPRSQERLEDLAPKLGLQFITNVQDRWMPFVRIGLSNHRMKLRSDRVESRTLPPSLGLNKESDVFGVRKEWIKNPQVWNGDIGVGLKFFLFPTTGINAEYRFSQSLKSITLYQREEGINSFQDQSGFVTETEWKGTRLTSQELSVAIEVDITD